jgi:glutathione S-transferase
MQTTTERPILHYFAARGRAQPLRHALADAGVPFEDVRVPLDAWPKLREDAAVSGPFAVLPTLRWGNALVAETLVIAAFLARRLGEHDHADDTAIARADALVSALYVDVMLPAGELIWADLLWPGTDLARATPSILGRMMTKLQRVEQWMRPSGGGWSSDERLRVADFFAGEAFELVTYLLDATRASQLAETLPTLAALARRLRERPSLAGAWAARPPTYTARPDESAVVERLRTFDAPLP